MTKKRTEGAGIHGPQERGSKTVSKTKRPGDCAPNTPPAGRAMRLLRQRDHDIEAMIQRELESAPAVDQQEKNGNSSYTEEVGREICVRVAYGQSLRYITSLNHMPSYWCLSKWLYGDVSEETVHGRNILSFRRMYGQAQQSQLDMLGDEMISIADDAHDRDSAAAATVKLKAREFKLERLDPKRWAQATRALEDNVVEDMATKMAEALELIADRRAKRQAALEQSPERVALCGSAAIDDAARSGDNALCHVESECANRTD